MIGLLQCKSMYELEETDLPLDYELGSLDRSVMIQLLLNVNHTTETFLVPAKCKK